MTGRSAACGRPLVWANGRLVCPLRSCKRHGQREERTLYPATVAMMALEEAL